MAKKALQFMTKTISALQARSQFGQILNRVTKSRERVMVTKKGEPTAVIMGIEEYLRLQGDTPPSLAALQAQAKKRGVADLTMEEIDAEIAAYRQEKRHKTPAKV